MYRIVYSDGIVGGPHSWREVLSYIRAALRYGSPTYDRPVGVERVR